MGDRVWERRRGDPEKFIFLKNDIMNPDILYSDKTLKIKIFYSVNIKNYAY